VTRKGVAYGRHSVIVASLAEIVPLRQADVNARGTPRAWVLGREAEEAACGPMSELHNPMRDLDLRQLSLRLQERAFGAPSPFGHEPDRRKDAKWRRRKAGNWRGGRRLGQGGIWALADSGTAGMPRPAGGSPPIAAPPPTSCPAPAGRRSSPLRSLNDRACMTGQAVLLARGILLHLIRGDGPLSTRQPLTLKRQDQPVAATRLTHIRSAAPEVSRQQPAQGLVSRSESDEPTSPGRSAPLATLDAGAPPERTLEDPLDSLWAELEYCRWWITLT
jgi:hypothetical protein